MSQVRVSIVQGDTLWHDPAGNRAMYGELVRPLAGRTDLVVLPETFTSGFTNETLGNAEGPNGESVAWLAKLANEIGAVVTGSMVTKDGEKFYNRLYWMRPDGTFDTYDKRHLFRYAGEHERYAPGRDRLIAELNGLKFCPMVCYDLRFPVYARNRVVDGAFDYDAILYVANWPSPRHYAWQTLLRARAIENLSYAIGVNRTGTDGNNHAYLGGSAVIDPLGAPIVECGAQAQAATVVISRDVVDAHRKRFPFHVDADKFELIA